MKTNEMPVNYIQHLTGFFEIIAQDNRLSMGHVALYATLFQFWNLNRFQNPMSIARSEIMLVSKIGSKSTYTKLLKELDEFGYIQYLPSNNPIKGSLVNLYTFGNSSEHSSGNTTNPTTGHSGVTLVVPSINSINKRKHINNKTREKENSKNEFPPTKKNKKMKIQNFTLPDLQEVQSYFLEKQNTTIEAERFFNYFESNGWLVGGKTKMKDWKAAARNWMMRSKEFQKEKQPSNPLSTNQNKDYSIPL